MEILILIFEGDGRLENVNSPSLFPKHFRITISFHSYKFVQEAVILLALSFPFYR